MRQARLRSWLRSVPFPEIWVSRSTVISNVAIQGIYRGTFFSVPDGMVIGDHVSHQCPCKYHHVTTPLIPVLREHHSSKTLNPSTFGLSRMQSHNRDQSYEAGLYAPTRFYKRIWPSSTPGRPRESEAATFCLWEIPLGDASKKRSTELVKLAPTSPPMPMPHPSSCMGTLHA